LNFPHGCGRRHDVCVPNAAVRDEPHATAVGREGEHAAIGERR
jgi:hypothetical protein